MLSAVQSVNWFDLIKKIPERVYTKSAGTPVAAATYILEFFHCHGVAILNLLKVWFFWTSLSLKNFALQ